MREPRAYQSASDLTAMLEVLQAGRRADNGSYYIHCGDLKWWLYYPPLEGDYWKDIFLWDDPDQPGRLLGWALVNSNWVGFDVYIQPGLRGSAIAVGMYDWTEQKAVQIARETGKKTVYTLWIRHDDEVLSDYFKIRGYQLSRGMVHLARNLNETISIQQPDEAVELRSCRGIPEVVSRATAQYGAFASPAPFERYLQRFEAFMHSPAYYCDLDIVAVTADGRIGAFCLVWLDPVNGVGLFEPVGTHPDFQRQGLGKAVMMEGIRRMQVRGMKQAIVSTYEDNDPALRLYETLGFRQVARLGTYEKDV